MYLYRYGRKKKKIFISDKSIRAASENNNTHRLYPIRRKKNVLTRFPEDYCVVWRKTVRGREHFRKNTVSIRSIRDIAIFPPSIFQYIHIKYEDVDYVFAGNNSNLFSFFMYAVAIRNIIQ